MSSANRNRNAARQTPPAASSTAGTPAATTTTRERKSPAESQAALIARARKMIAKATATLQAAQIRQSGRPGGNPELIAAFEQFDAALVNLNKTDDEAITE